MAANFNLLHYFYEQENSYIKATIAYIEQLDIEIEEFKVSDLPKEWILLLEQEARQNKLLKEEVKTNSFFKLLVVS